MVGVAFAAAAGDVAEADLGVGTGFLALVLGLLLGAVFVAGADLC